MQAFSTYRVPVEAGVTRHHAARTYYALELESEGQDGVRLGFGRPPKLDGWSAEDLARETIPLEHAETSAPAAGEELGFYLVFPAGIETAAPDGSTLFYTVRVWHVREAQYARALGKRKAPPRLFLLSEGLGTLAPGAVQWFPGPDATVFYNVLQELGLHREHPLTRGYQMFGYIVSPDSDLFDVWLRVNVPGASNSVGLGRIASTTSTSPVGAGFVALNGRVVPVHEFLLRLVNQDTVTIELAWGFGIVDAA